MRHWLWFKTTGEIGGELVQGGGWDLSADLNRVGSPDETVQANRQFFTQQPGFAGFLQYDCPCTPAVVWCDCARQRLLDYRVVGGGTAYELKPVYDVLVDGSIVTPGSTTDKTPLASTALRLEGDVPDGVEIQAVNVAPGADLLQTSPAILTFSGGVTNTINLVAPVHGMTGGLGLTPVNREEAVIRHFKLRGWSA